MSPIVYNLLLINIRSSSDSLKFFQVIGRNISPTDAKKVALQESVISNTSEREKKYWDGVSSCTFQFIDGCCFCKLYKAIRNWIRHEVRNLLTMYAPCRYIFMSKSVHWDVIKGSISLLLTVKPPLDSYNWIMKCQIRLHILNKNKLPIHNFYIKRTHIYTAQWHYKNCACCVVIPSFTNISLTDNKIKYIILLSCARTFARKNKSTICAVLKD